MFPPLTYGSLPASIVLIHGGPAAPGNIAVLAAKLTKFGGVLQVRQDLDKVDPLIIDIDDQISGQSVSKPVLIGHSFGAWIAALYAAKYPKKVSKLILFGTGPLEFEYVHLIHETRMKRLNKKNAKEYKNSLDMIYNLDVQRARLAMRRLKGLTEITDQFNPVRRQDFSPPVNLHLFKSLSEDINQYRKSGKLLAAFSDIKVPIKFIHGKYDPHPVSGFTEPLDKTGISYEMTVLEKCGHELWMEINCTNKFNDILKAELS